MPTGDFNILHALVLRPELMELTARWLDPESLSCLYTASRRFHYVMNTRYHYYIKGCASIWAPFGRRVFPFHAFRDLCIEDPAARSNPDATERVRHVPSLRWLKMTAWRQTVVDEILALLDAAGHRLPRDTHITLQKFWFTMSLPGNGARIGLLHNRAYWTDADLHLATHFCLKLDLHCTDPHCGTGGHNLRDIFLGKRSLVALLRLLRGDYSALQLLQHHAAHALRQPPGLRHYSLLGVPAALVGRGSYEGWGANADAEAPRALGVAQGIMLEGMHRQLHMNRFFLDMLLYGCSALTDNVAYHLDCKEPREFDERVAFVDWRLRTYGIEEV